MILIEYPYFSEIIGLRTNEFILSNILLTSITGAKILSNVLCGILNIKYASSDVIKSFINSKSTVITVPYETFLL